MQQIFQLAKTLVNLPTRKINLSAHLGGQIGPDQERLGIALLPVANEIDSHLAFV